MRSRIGALVMLAAGIVAAPALAHHSVPGTFNVEKTVAIKGTISKIDWINPHIYIYVDVKDPAGAVTTWKVETLPTNHMRRAGVTKERDLARGQGGRCHRAHVPRASQQDRRFPPAADVPRRPFHAPVR